METIHDANPLSFHRVERIFHAAPQIGELIASEQEVSGATPGRILSSRRYPLTLARDRFVAPQVKENSHTFQTDKWIRQGYHRPFGFLQPLRSASSNQAKHVVTTKQLVKLIATAAIVMSTVCMGLPCFLNSAKIIPKRNAAVSSKGQIVSAGRTARGAFILRSLVPSGTRSLMRSEYRVGS